MDNKEQINDLINEVMRYKTKVKSLQEENKRLREELIEKWNKGYQDGLNDGLAH